MSASRDATVASIWRALNAFTLRVGFAAGFLASAGYIVLALVSGDVQFFASASLAAAVGIAGFIGTARGSADAEPVIIAAAVAAVTASTFTSPLIRGGLWAAIAVLAMVGALLLPATKQRRFLAAMGALLFGQLLFPVLGFAPLVDTVANLIISIACAGAGIAVVTIAKHALDESERTRIEIFRSVPVGLFRCNRSGEIIDANPALTAMLGYEEPNGLVGRQVADLHAAPDEWTALADLLESTAEPRRFAHRLKRQHGTTLWVRGYAQAVRDEGGSVLYHEGSIEDMTQRRQAEQASRLNAERFRNVFERAPIAIWEEDFSDVGKRLETLRGAGVADLRSYLEEHPEECTKLIGLVRFLDVNPAGIALIGAQSKAQALTSVVPDIAPAAVVEGFVEEFVAIWEDRDALMMELQGATVAGDTTELAFSWAVPRDEDGSLDLARVIVVIQDIAIIKNAERELAKLVESKDDLIAAVSHELRTPITTILGMAFELRDHSGTFTEEEISDFSSMIADQSRELSNIVEDLLVAAHSEAGTLTIRLENVDIQLEIAHILTADPHDPVVCIEGNVMAWADPLRLRQILRNLFSNAARYGGSKVTVEAETEGAVTWIRVRDNGVGIARSQRETIFEPYVHSPGDAALPGSLGLGLPVSRTLARLMGGDLVYRHDGSSVFELSLPCEAEAA